MAYTTINKSTDYFNTKLYTGNGGTQSITGVGFQPDLNWTKQRNVNQDNTLTDSIRGVGKLLFSSDTAAENTDVNSLTSFNSDGFSVGTSGYMNTNSNTYASWNWKANGAGSANTDGSISSTVSASATSGFSIVSYTATGSTATIGHGLGSIPKMMIIKNTTSNSTWAVYNASLGTGKFLRLNATDAEAVDSGAFNNTAPTSSVFSLGTNNTSNDSGDSMIAYCFAEKQGFSKFGSYVGNGSASSGTFVYTGFKPAYVMLKRSDTAGERWNIKDNKRDGYNQTDPVLTADSSGSEYDDAQMDLLSNGFKIRTSAVSTNASGGTYIYMAFAEAPLVGTNNVPCTAR